jgi:hypothetical protein
LITSVIVLANVPAVLPAWADIVPVITPAVAEDPIPVPVIVAPALLIVARAAFLNQIFK